MLMQLDDAKNIMSSHDSALATTTKAEEAVFSSTTASTNVAAVNAKHHKSPSLSSMNALPHQSTTTNQWNGSSPEAMALAFGENRKAHMAARAMFELVHQFGDNLREGWKNVLDLLLQLLRADLLPVQLLLLEDFVDPRGKVSLKERFRRRQAVPKKEESGLFSWLGFTSSSGPSESDPKRPSEEERELFKLAASVISECHPEQLVPDSRYLASSALTELINNIVHCSIALAPHEQAEHVPHEQQQQHESQGSQSQDDDSLVDLSPAAALLPKHGHGPGVVHHQQHDHPVEKRTSNCSNSEGHGRHSGPGNPPQPVVFELSMEEEEALVFLLELMVNIVLENRDRLAQVWPLVSDHLGWLLSHFPRNRQLMERAVVSLVRIANRNLFRLGQQPVPQPVAKASEMPWKKGGGGQNMAKSVVIVVDEDEQQKEAEEFKTFRQGHNHPPDQSIQGRTNECLADLVLHFMGTRLLALRPPELFLHSRPIAYGLHTLLRANAANVHSGEHWSMFFELLEAVGAAQYPEQWEGEEAEQYFLVEPKSRANATSASRQKSRKSAAQHARAVHATAAMAQSEPEEMATSPDRRQQTVVERGYCSDEPSSAVAMECGQKPGERKQQNPLLAAAEQLRLPQLGKADSGEEWIHVVGPAGMQKAVDEHQLQQLGKIREHGAPAEQLQLGAVPLSAPVGHGQHVQAGIPPQNAIESGTNDGQQNQTEQQFQAHQVQAVQPQQQPEQPVPSPPPEAVDEPAAAVPVPLPPPPPHPRAGLFKRGTIVLAPHLSRHDPAAFLRVVDTLVFLARDAAHITPANFTQFTRCLRVMVEASMDGGKCAPMSLPNAVAAPPAAIPATAPASSPQSSSASKQFSIPHEAEKQQKPENAIAGGEGEEEKMSEQERLANCYMDASLQLLNICAQLHGLAANIHADWSSQEEGGDGTEKQEKPNANAASPGSGCTELWSAYWRPLLQAMARMCCDCRRRIRAQALDALGTAFRVPALGQWMGAADWEDCFAEVLFPLLGRLLSSSPPISPMDPLGMEEARIRAIQLACKVLLGHLTQIGRLDTFADLLRRLFDLFDQFLEGSSACSDLLAEVVQESLKNCVLVCESFGIFQGPLEGLRGEMAERLGALAKKHGAETATSGGLKWG